VKVLVNRRSDVALACGADGVHLGFDALPSGVARELLGPDALIGRSVHAADEIAPDDDLSYVHLAPVFAPLSKPASRPALGMAGLRAACQRGVPVLAQGGVDSGNAGAILKAGAAGIAVTGAILMQADPGAAAIALRRRLDA
jgi:thiamine-phosphate pyrophosphorylase